jgi:ATP-dependent Clp protease ATP-binding subunit ClpC
MAFDATFPVNILHRKLGPGVLLAEPLFVPQFSRLANSTENAADLIRELLDVHFKNRTPAELFQDRQATPATAAAFTVTVTPPRANISWREPVTLTLNIAKWNHPSGHVIARIPALGIDVLADSENELFDTLQAEALTALRRLNVTVNLHALAGVARHGGFRIDASTVTVKLLNLKERAKQEKGEANAKKSTLDTVASRMHWQRQERAFELDAIVRQMAEALTAKPAQSVLLIGPSGVGKTAAIRQLVRQRAEFRLAETPFFQTSGSRIVAGQCGFGMWEQRCQDLVKEASKLRAVVSLGQLVELLNVGKSEFNPTGLASFLRPAIARGELLAIAECTPEQVTTIEKEEPQLLDAFRQITLEEPDMPTGRRILASFANRQMRRQLPADVLDLIDRLHRRFATYSAIPGRPLTFLDTLLKDTDRTDAITVAEVYDGFTRETGLPRAMIDPAAAFDLAATREWFASRIIGQSEATDLVTDLLATVKTGLTRPGRPIASLLFIGPTGVGKTETAKALAEFLFGSPDRLTRFDMSEYADPVSVRRLVGGVTGSEGLLTSKVREQPFSVILFDEIEKAHASMFDLLLQVLGEARLTDAAGRLADFRNTVIVLTSNLGAESFRAGTAGFNITMVRDAKSHFMKAVESFLRPELVNRLDRLVPFVSLGPEVIRRIAAREWNKVLARDGLRFRSVQLTTDDSLQDRIAAAGFDPKYGARPLQRTMERQLLAPLAKQLNRHAGNVPLTAVISVEPADVVIRVTPVQGAKPMMASATSPAGLIAEEARTNRRWHQKLEQSTVYREICNELTQYEYQERSILKKQAKGQPLSGELQRVLTEVGRLRELQNQIAELRVESEGIEDAAVEAFHTAGDHENVAIRERIQQAGTAWHHLLLKLYARSAPGSSSVSLAIFSENPDILINYSRAYHKLAMSLGLTVDEIIYRLPDEHLRTAKAELPPKLAQSREATVWLEDDLIDKASGNLYVMHREGKLFPHPSLLGVGLRIRGNGAHLHFAAEAGIHAFPRVGDAPRPTVWVNVLPGELLDYRPDPKLTRKGSLPEEPPRRMYSTSTVSDRDFTEPLVNVLGTLADKLAFVIKAAARVRLIRNVLE